MTINPMPIKSLDLVRDAVEAFTKNWKPLIRALLVPASLIALLDVLYNWQIQIIRGDNSSNIYKGYQLIVIYYWWLFLTTIVYTTFAVSCHRIIILGSGSLPNKLGIYFTWRELRFLWWGFILSLPVGLFIIATESLLSELPTSLNEQDYWALREIQSALIGLIGLIALSFVGMILPGTAIKGKFSIKQALALSKGNVITIFTAVLVPALLIGGFAICFNFVVYSFEPMQESLIPIYIESIFFLLLGVVEIAVLSMAYQKLMPANGVPKNT